MKAPRIGSVARKDSNLGSLTARIGRIVAYLGIPASTLSAATGILTTVNVLTSFYVVAGLGVVAAIRGARPRPDLLAVSYFFLACYGILLAIELSHGGPFHYPLPRGANFLTDYFPLVAFPFFVLALTLSGIEIRNVARVAALTIVFSAGLSLYQFFVLDIQRTRGFSLNPIPFALIILMWSLLLFARAFRARKIEWLPFAAAIAGIIPIMLSGSKLVWACGALGFFLLFVLWALAARRWLVLAVTIAATLPIAWLLSRFETVNIRLVEFTRDFGRALSGDTSGESFGIRLEAIVSGFLAFLQRPLLGYGLAEGKTAALNHQLASFHGFARLPHLHNDYVTHLVAFGILGLVFIVSLFTVFILVAASRDDLAIRRFGVVAAIVFLVYMGAEVVFTQPEVYGLVFFLLGLVAAVPPRLGAWSPGVPQWLTGIHPGAPLPRSPGQIAPSRQGRGRWTAAAGTLFLLVGFCIGLIGFAWTQRALVIRVAQTAEVYEQPNRPGLKESDVNKLDASVRWSFLPNEATGAALAADFDIPATGATIRLIVRKNVDPALPVSHVMEVTTTPPRDFSEKAIANIGKLEAKLTPSQPGVALIGDVAEIDSGIFWIGLSAIPAEAEANLRLLELAAFFDLPLTYKSGQHAVLRFEKGTTGERAFQEAMAALRR